MNLTPPTQAQVRAILASTPHFHWPTFSHQPLNCFDLTAALLTFPGDITKDRTQAPYYYAGYCIDIDNLDTCPRRHEAMDADLWNAECSAVRWRLGTVRWTCTVDVGDYAISKGFFRVLIGVTRYQNIDNVSDISDLAQLRRALYASVQVDLEAGSMQPFAPETMFEREIGGRTWLIARSLNGLHYPTYEIVSPIDHRTTICISATLDNCWFWGEIIPTEVEEKHLASLWDYIAHISLQDDRAANDSTVGTTSREAPGQAEKVPDDSLDW